MKTIENDDFSRHIILYAKGHYKKTGNLIEDLRTIICQVAELNREHVSEQDIWEHCYNTFLNYLELRQQEQWLNRLFVNGWVSNQFTHKADFMDNLQHMIGLFSVIRVAGNPKMEGLGKPDPGIMELKKKEQDEN